MDSIEVEVSHIGELVFLEKLKEIIVDETGGVNVYAIGGEDNRRYSNCSFLKIDASVEKGQMITQVRHPFTYDLYLNYLDRIYNTNTHYQRLMESYSYSNYLNPRLYESYVQLELVSNAWLEETFKFYRNYGLCTDIVFRGN